MYTYYRCNFFLLVSIVLISVLNSEKTTTKILESENELNENGYHFLYKNSDGTERKETGTKQDNIIIVKGSYEYIGSDGKIYSVSYVADQNGYHPKIKVKTTRPSDEKLKNIPETPEKVEGRGLLNGESEKINHNDLPDDEIGTDIRILSSVVETLVGPG